MGGQIKLKNNEAFELSGCLIRLAQSKVFQDLKIVCQVLCICCLAKAFRHFLGNLLVVGDVQPNTSLLSSVYVYNSSTSNTGNTSRSSLLWGKADYWHETKRLHFGRSRLSVKSGQSMNRGQAWRWGSPMDNGFKSI